MRTLIRIRSKTALVCIVSVLGSAIPGSAMVGNGPDATGLQGGIAIWAHATGEVERNIITDHAYTGTNAPYPYTPAVLRPLIFQITAERTSRPSHAAVPSDSPEQIFRLVKP